MRRGGRGEGEGRERRGKGEGEGRGKCEHTSRGGSIHGIMYDDVSFEDDVIRTMNREEGRENKRESERRGTYK